MRSFAVVMLLAACSGSPAGSSAAVGSSGSAAAAAAAASGSAAAGSGAAAASPAPAPKPTARLWTIAELAAAGAKVTKVSDTESLVCGSQGTCICMKDLACGAKGCITLAANLAAFKKALASDGDRQVSCEIADTGKFCDLSYFRFEGDIYRWETRFFDASGHLVAQRNGTDYPEYCGGQANLQVTGPLPDCALQPQHVELICAEDRFKSKVGQLPNPRELIVP